MKKRSMWRFAAEGFEGVVVVATALCTRPISRRWLRNWGSSRSERQREWIGDRLLGANMAGNTRAITINAPTQVVWRWLTGFGLGRAGFFSYELLERLVGIPVTNLESCDPGFDRLGVGDEISLHPKAAIRIAALERGRSLCFGDDPDIIPETRPAIARSWSMYVDPVDPNSSRLIIRGCYEETRKRSLLERLAFAVEQPIDFTMEQRMLRTLKRLAETEHTVASNAQPFKDPNASARSQSN